MNYQDDFKKEFPKIRPFMEDDLEWFNEGMELLDRGKLKETEKRFKQLTLSQPNHPDGVDGLSRVYQKMGEKKKALFFINEAIKMSKKIVASGEADSEMLTLMQDLKAEIEKM